jgi:O-antigen ligase
MTTSPPARGRSMEVAGAGEEGEPTGRRISRLAVRRGIVFAIAIALPAWLALEGGGFDTVVRQQGGLLIWWALALGFLSGWLPRSRPAASLLWPAVAIAALVGWTLLSFGWTESDEGTYAELSRLLGYAGFVVAAWACLNRFTFRAAAAGVSIAALGISVLALLSRLAPSAFPVDLIAVAFDTDRLNYPLDYWNAVAAWGCISIAIALVWSAHARNAVVRALAAAAVPAAATAVFLTYSRAGVAGAALAVFAALALSRNRWTLAANAAAAAVASGIAIAVANGEPAIADATGGEGGATVFVVVLLVGAACGAVAAVTRQAGLDRVRLARVSRPLVAAACAVGVLAAAAALAGPASSAWDEFLNEETATETGTARGTERLTSLGGDRDELWASALDAFSDESVTGVGPGSFELHWNRDGRDATPVEDAHSLYLETLAELGLPGLLLLLGAVSGLWAAGFIARRGMRRSNDFGACAAMLAGSTVFLFHAGVDWMWEYPAVAAIGIGGLAVASAAGLERSTGGDRIRIGWRAAILVACLAVGAVQVPGIVSTERVRDSEEALASGDASEALELADDASEAQPWAASPLSQRALAHERLGELDQAREDLIEAREKEPANWLWAAQLAGVEQRRGEPEAAARQAAEARALNKVSEIEGLPGER